MLNKIKEKNLVAPIVGGVILIVVALIIIFAGKTPEEKILGTWTNSNGFEFTFKENGDCNATHDLKENSAYVEKCSWTLQSDTLKVDYVMTVSSGYLTLSEPVSVVSKMENNYKNFTFGTAVYEKID